MSSISFDNCHNSSSYSSTEYRRNIVVCISASYKINMTNRKMRKEEEKETKTSLYSDARNETVYLAVK